jgi:hypothetical protein
MFTNVFDKYDFVDGAIIPRPTEPEVFGSLRSPEALRPLSQEEEITLAECETVVDEHRESFFKAASALLTLHDQRLYLKTHNTFHAYVQERFGFQRAHAYRQMNAARLLVQMSPTGDIAHEVTEGVVRKVEALPSTERQAVVDEVRRSGGPVTKANINQAYEKLAPAKKPAKSVKINSAECPSTEPTMKPAVSVNHLKELADKAVALFKDNRDSDALANILQELQAGLTCLALQNN